MNTLICPKCSKKIGVPDSKMGRWIACPACAMEFAAIKDDAPETGEIYEYNEPSSRSLPVGLIVSLAVAAFVGGIVCTIAITQRTAPAVASNGRSDKTSSNPSRSEPIQQEVIAPSVASSVPHGTVAAVPKNRNPAPAVNYPSITFKPGSIPDLPGISATSNAKDVVKKWLTESVDDTDGLEFVKWDEPVTITMRRDNSPATAIRVLYRARNRLGAKELNDRAFVVHNGKVIGDSGISSPGTAALVAQWAIIGYGSAMEQFEDFYNGAKAMHENRKRK